MATITDIRRGHIVHSSQTGLTYYVDKVNPKNYVLVKLDGALPTAWPASYNYRRSGVATLRVEDRDLTPVETAMLKNAYIDIVPRPRAVVREVDSGVRLGAAVTVPNSTKIDPEVVYVIIQDLGDRVTMIELGGNDNGGTWTIGRPSVKVFTP